MQGERDAGKIWIIKQELSPMRNPRASARDCPEAYTGPRGTHPLRVASVIMVTGYNMGRDTYGQRHSSCTFQPSYCRGPFAPLAASRLLLASEDSLRACPCRSAPPCISSASTRMITDIQVLPLYLLFFSSWRSRRREPLLASTSPRFRHRVQGPTPSRWPAGPASGS